MKGNNIKISTPRLLINNISINQKTLEEKSTSVDELIPYRSSRYTTASVIGGVFPWHWHDEVEIFYVREGEMIYCLQGEEVLFCEGDVGFINSDVLHMTKPAEGQDSIEQNHIFLPDLICQERGSGLALKYVTPLLSNRNAKIIRIPADTDEAKEAIRVMDRTFEADYGKEYGRELIIREQMTKLWLLFLRTMPASSRQEDPIDSQRLMQMLRFINDHYDEKILMDDIAGAAHISVKEAERCFKRQIKQLPFEYLMDFRLEKARERLQKDEESITQIGAACGFGSSSYFTKCFKDKYQLTPKDYRAVLRFRQSGPAD